jgi:hypothetical protein
VKSDVSQVFKREHLHRYTLESPSDAALQNLINQFGLSFFGRLGVVSEPVIS